MADLDRGHPRYYNPNHRYRKEAVKLPEELSDEIKGEIRTLLKEDRETETARKKKRTYSFITVFAWLVAFVLFGLSGWECITEGSMYAAFLYGLCALLIFTAIWTEEIVDRLEKLVSKIPEAEP